MLACAFFRCTLFLQFFDKVATLPIQREFFQIPVAKKKKIYLSFFQLLDVAPPLYMASGTPRQKLRIARQYQGTQSGGALQRTTRRRTGDSTFRTERKKNGDTETYKALPRKDIFRTFNVVRRNTSKINFGGSKPDDLNDSLSFSTKEQLKALTILPYAK